MKKVLIFKEKHGNWYYDASTTEDELKAYVAVLHRRLGEGYWYEDEFYNNDDRQMKLGQTTPPLTPKEQAAEILTRPFPESGKLARRFIMNRDGEYEGYECERIEEVSPDILV